MAISYSKLWKLLIDRKMSQADSRREAEIAPNTMTKPHRDEPVANGVLEKIRKTLNINYGDIMDHVADDGEH